MLLNGETAILGIIGDPVAQVKSPAALTQLMQRRGINCVLVPLHVAAADVTSLLDALRAVKNFAGLIVTVPHKQLVAQLPITRSVAALEAEAVNVIRKSGGEWQGDLLDGVGFLQGLSHGGCDVRGKTVAIAGAGGAGNAIAFTLAAAGATRIGIHDLNSQKKLALVARLKALGYSAYEWDGTATSDLLVNATPLGMKPGDALPIDPASIRPGITVAEVIMEPHTTELLKRASQMGANIIHGRGMMDHQLERMADFFGEVINSRYMTNV